MVMAYQLFINELGKKFNKDDIGVIAENKENYISFNVKINIQLARVITKDDKEVRKNIHLGFLASSLDKLVSNLDDDQCKNFREFYKGDEVFKLMKRKGEYMDGWEKLEEAKLPLKNAFYSKLKMKNISDQLVWKRIAPEFENVTLREYHDVYLATNKCFPVSRCI